MAIEEVEEEALLERRRRPTPSQCDEEELGSPTKDVLMHLEPVDADALLAMLRFAGPKAQENLVLVSIVEGPLERAHVEVMPGVGVGASNAAAKPARAVVVAKSPPPKKVSAGALLLAQREAKVEVVRKAGAGRFHAVRLLLPRW